jgi:hypothetical protein
MRLDDIRTLVQVQSLAQRGVLVELEPAPITGPRSQHYQLLSGRLPAGFGFFDTLMPLCHLPHPLQGSDGYDVVEVLEAMDSAPHMLPDLLAAAGWMTEYVETAPAELAECARRLTLPRSDGASCVIVKCTPAGDGRLTAPSEAQAIDEALRIARQWVGESGVLALLTDMQPAHVRALVNINNFLAEMGLIERGERDRPNWAGTLAYHVGHGQLWMNVAGREPQGAVHPGDEYEEVRDTLIKALPIRVLDPQTGMPVIEKVCRREDLYPDRYLFCAPDLVVLFKRGYAPSPVSARLGFDETIFTVPAASPAAMAGAHPSELKGFLLAAAPSMLAGVSLPESAPLIAAAPSLLHALGVQHADMDSAALGRLFKPSYLETHPIAEMRNQELSEEDEQLVVDRLRDLGYI